MTSTRKPLGAEQEKQLKHMENAISSIKKELEEVRKTQTESANKLNEILVAVKGDDMGNEGFAKRMTSIEHRMEKYDENNTKTNVYVRIITFLLGIIAIGVIGFLINVILHKN